MKITWLGQSGYLVELGGQRLLIDPYLSDVVERREGLRRLVAPPCALERLTPDVLFITHDHLDHYDPETVPRLMALFPECRLIGPGSVIAHAMRDSIATNRLTRIAAGERIAWNTVRLTATPARHSDPAAIGLRVESAPGSAWFSGDPLYFPELAAQVRGASAGVPELAFICINGRLGNMNLEEAARVVAELRPRLAVPTHYGMFAENTADPAAFVAACAARGVRGVALSHGELVDSDVLLRTGEVPLSSA